MIQLSEDVGGRLRNGKFRDAWDIYRREVEFGDEQVGQWLCALASCFGNQMPDGQIAFVAEAALAALGVEFD